MKLHIHSAQVGAQLISIHAAPESLTLHDKLRKDAHGYPKETLACQHKGRQGADCVVTHPADLLTHTLCGDGPQPSAVTTEHTNPSLRRQQQQQNTNAKAPCAAAGTHTLRLTVEGTGAMLLRALCKGAPQPWCIYQVKTGLRLGRAACTGSSA